jgi:ribonuclease H2 subunit A
MVYGLFYLPAELHHSLLAETYHFDDSKVLTPKFRSSLMQTLCTPGTPLYTHCGWATRVMSARDISAGMLRRTAPYNLNAQAMDATIDLIKAVLAKGVNVMHIYIDTIGKPEVYQKKLEKIFPAKKITVAKKADSLYPCVSAASVCAKVTRDVALEMSYESAYATSSSAGWGSGYPSDARCSRWLKDNMHPVFGWGPECRFSWGTAKELLEIKNKRIRLDWPDEKDTANGTKISDFFIGQDMDEEDAAGLKNWFSQRGKQMAF